MKVYFYAQIDKLSNDECVFIGEIHDHRILDDFVTASVKNICANKHWEDAIIIGEGYTVRDNYHILLRPLNPTGGENN